MISKKKSITVTKNTINFPVVEYETIDKIDLNWFALNKKFKSIFSFIYEKKKQNKYLNKSSIINGINYRWYFDNLKIKVYKYYECYVLIWDYYINKNQNYDLNNRINEVLNYE